MELELEPNLEAAIVAEEEQRGVSPESLARQTLRKRFLPPEAVDQWHRLLRTGATDCEVSLPNEAFSRGELYG